MVEQNILDIIVRTAFVSSFITAVWMAFVALVAVRYFDVGKRRIRHSNALEEPILHWGDVPCELDPTSLTAHMRASGHMIRTSTVASVLESLRIKHFCILVGGNGVGKTSLFYRLEDAIRNATRWPVATLHCLIHPNLRDERSFIGTYDRMNRTYVDPFSVTKFLLDANANPKIPHFLLLDEMNSSRIEEYFPWILEFEGAIRNDRNTFFRIWNTQETVDTSQARAMESLVHTFGFLVKNSGWILEIGVCMPKNLYIIGTMNVDAYGEPLSGKIIERSGIVWIDGNRNEEGEQQNFESIDIGETPYVRVQSKDVSEFVEAIDARGLVSPRRKRDLLEFVTNHARNEERFVADALETFLFPLAYGEEWKEKLDTLLRIMIEFRERIPLDPAIRTAEALLKEPYVNYYRNT